MTSAKTKRKYVMSWALTNPRPRISDEQAQQLSQKFIATINKLHDLYDAFNAESQEARTYATNLYHTNLDELLRIACPIIPEDCQRFIDASAKRSVKSTL